MSKRKNVNTEIEALLDKKQKDGDTFSISEIEFIQQYTGKGGLQREGVTDRGVLYEYYTPYPIVEKMWGLAYQYGFDGGLILEPSCGIGRFLRYVDPTNCTAEAFEFSKDDNNGYRIAKVSYPWAKITNDYFESMFYRDNKRVQVAPKYNLVIGNPPYGKFTGFYAGREHNKTLATLYEHYFMEKGVDLLLQGGLLIFIIPSGFLQNSDKYTEFKKKLFEKADLIDAYRMPAGVFDATEVQTDIIVLKKK